MKILIVSTVGRQINLFEKNNIDVLKELGYEIHVAASFDDAIDNKNTDNLIKHSISIKRSPISIYNIRAYFELKRIIITHKYDIIHCHTPVGGLLTRLVAKSLKLSNIIYTAHGFHFYSGAPIINWLIYYPIEVFLSKYTRVILTINREDYRRAKSFTKGAEIFYIPGVGIDTSNPNIDTLKKNQLKSEFMISNKSKVLITVGELNKNKNQLIILKALNRLKDLNIHLIICGKGSMESKLKHYVDKNNMKHLVHFTGYVDNINDYYSISDVFVFPSYREGLSVSLMEAMKFGLPVICSKIRGNIDLISDGEGGDFFHPNDYKKLSVYIKKLVLDNERRECYGKNNKTKIEIFSSAKVIEIMRNIYKL